MSKRIGSIRRGRMPRHEHALKWEFEPGRRPVWRTLPARNFASSNPTLARFLSSHQNMPHASILDAAPEFRPCATPAELNPWASIPNVKPVSNPPPDRPAGLGFQRWLPPLVCTHAQGSSGSASGPRYRQSPSDSHRNPGTSRYRSETPAWRRCAQLMGASGLSLSILPRGRRGTILERCLKLGANTRATASPLNSNPSRLSSQRFKHDMCRTIPERSLVAVHHSAEPKH